MSNKIIVDTGPIVAFFCQNDHYSEWTQEQFRRLKPPFYTCEAVITEATFLLSRVSSAAPSEFFKLLAHELIIVDFSLKEEINAISTLMAKYHKVPMSLADACLVRMSEQHSNSLLLTLDSDFTIYRKHGRQTLDLCIPE